ncbi:MAG: hypothetical protein ACKOA2_10785 [Ilumatobacteraceae bacterium]
MRRILLAAVVLGTGLAVTLPAFAATVGVSVGNYYFEDATVGDGKVTAKVGDQLRFTVVEGAGHTVTIDELGIDSGQLSPGAVFVTPVMQTPGTYTLYCKPHLSRGHRTTLVITGTATPTTTTAPATTTTTPITTTTTRPGVTTPGTTTPGGTTPGGTVPGDTLPSGSTPGDTTPGANTPDGTPSDTTLAIGVTDDGGTPWLRSVSAAVIAIPIVAIAAAVATAMAARRSRRGIIS